jgi:PAS domain S-box-containing protein
MKKEIHVLYVDDEPALLDIVQTFLQITGEFVVTTLDTADSALLLIKEQAFDALVSDYQMPDMDGIEFLKKVRGSGNSIPFIIFTGKGREEVVIQALNEGADFYLQKGGDPKSQFTELAHKIRLAVRQRGLESSVRDYERREADILNFLPDATFAINTEGIVIAWNQAMEEMTGVSASKILGKGDFEYSIPFYQERRPMLINLVLKDDPVIYRTYSSINRNRDLISSEITIPSFHEGTGASFWFTASPLYDNEGRIAGAIESIREITDIKRAEQNLIRKHEELQAAYEQISATEEELRANYQEIIQKGEELEKKEQHLRAITNNIPGVVYRCHVRSDNKLRIDFISTKSLEILGLESNPVIFYDVFVQGIDDYDRPRFINMVNQAILLKIPFDFEGKYVKPSGERIWIKFVSSLDINQESLLYNGIIFDNTALKEQDETRRFLAHVLDNSPASITVHDFDGNMLYANEKTFELHGYTHEEFLAKNLHDIDAPDSELLIHNRLDEVFKNNSLEFDVHHIRKDGSLIPLHVNLKKIVWRGKNVLLSIATDITVQKRVEEELKKKAEELNLRTRLLTVLLETVPIGVFMVEAPSGRALISNQAATKLLGRGVLSDTSEKNLSEKYEAYRIGTSQKYPASEMPIIQGMYGKSSHIDDMVVVRPDGTQVLLEVFGNPVTDNHGHIIASLVSFIDITERKRIENLLKESEENARALINAQKESIFMMKPDGTILYANDTMAYRFGYFAQDLIGKCVYDLAPAEVSERRREYVDRMMQTRDTVHFIDQRFGRIMENYLYPILGNDGEVSRIAVYGRDITEKQEAEQQIAESEEKYRSVVEQAHDGIVIVQNNLLVFVNEAFAYMSGYDQNELMGMSYLEFIQEKNIYEVKNYGDETLLCMEKPTSREIDLIRKDKTTFTVEVNAAGISYNGTPGCLFLIRDISDRKHAEELQKKTMNLLNEVQRISKVGGWEIDVQSGRISWTEEVYHIHGVGHEYDPNDIQKNISFYAPDDARIIETAFHRAVNEGIPYDLELNFIQNDGKQIWVRTMGNPVFEGNKVIKVTGNIMDITERKHLELSLREALLKLKVLTGITRHDVVNDLSVLYLSLDMMRESDDEAIKHEYLLKAVDAVDILKKTIEFTREYENFGSVSSKWENLLEIVTGAQLDVALTNIKTDISLPSNLQLYSDPIIRKVFTTLFENSSRHGGKNLSKIRIFLQDVGMDTLIVYEDDGIGIPEQEKALIFNHGYGRHTGIGLFLVHEILSILGLSIRECGIEGNGVRFEIFVPSGSYRYQNSI